ncbi:hypothetical protein [Kaistia sp. MMO-174]|uniref:hypothetical protein n=1 Tax=Kaistia sp. MMO-174 TaxID=3081256 RepID=UPI0030181DF9
MAQDIEKIDPETGEVILFTETAQPLAVQLAQAELNQAVTTAKAFPRSITQAVQNIMSLATLDEEAAKESVYALPRGGKPIKGPSIRFAEIVASQWGNCHTGSRIVAVDRFEKVVIAEGVFLDLETGMKRTAQIRRRISDKNGRIFNDDMITVTGNAAASIAMREAILKGIPKAVWRKAYERCEGVIAGDIKTLAVRRDDAIKAFAVWGVKPEQIFAALEVGGLDDVGLDQLATLTAMHKAIKGGEQKVEDYFPAKVEGDKAVEAAKGTAAKLGKIAEGAASANRDDSAEHKKPAAGSGRTTTHNAAEAEQAQISSGEDRRSPDDGPTDDEGAAGAEPRTFTDAEIEGAFQRGEEAKAKGMSRKALPPEWKAEGFEPLADAWVRGFTGA